MKPRPFSNATFHPKFSDLQGVFEDAAVGGGSCRHTPRKPRLDEMDAKPMLRYFPRPKRNRI